MRALAKLSLALGVTGLLLLTLAGTAAAQTDLVLDVPDVLAPNVQFNVNAAYSLNGGTYDDVVVTLELPAHVTIITTTLEADTFPEQACAANATTASDSAEERLMRTRSRSPRGWPAASGRSPHRGCRSPARASAPRT